MGGDPVQTLLYRQEKLCELLGLIHPMAGSALWLCAASGLREQAISLSTPTTRTHAHAHTRAQFCCLFLWDVPAELDKPKT